MKTSFSFLAIALMLISCGNNSANGEHTNDSIGTTAIDTGTQHPNGITSGSVISTDTASISADNTGNVRGGDSTNPK